MHIRHCALVSCSSSGSAGAGGAHLDRLSKVYFCTLIVLDYLGKESRVVIQVDYIVWICGNGSFKVDLDQQPKSAQSMLDAFEHLCFLESPPHSCKEPCIAPAHRIILRLLNMIKQEQTTHPR